MVDKLKMHTITKTDENFKRLAEMITNTVTKTIDENGNVVRTIEKNMMM